MNADEYKNEWRSTWRSSSEISRLKLPENRASSLMLWHIGRPIGRCIPISKGYSKEITIIYTVRAYKRRSRVVRYLPPVFHVCMHTCSILSRDPTIFVPRKSETHWCSRLKINQAQTCYAHINANHVFRVFVI